jgi:hypothetical protein
VCSCLLFVVHFCGIDNYRPQREAKIPRQVPLTSAPPLYSRKPPLHPNVVWFSDHLDPVITGVTVYFASIPLLWYFLDNVLVGYNTTQHNTTRQLHMYLLLLSRGYVCSLCSLPVRWLLGYLVPIFSGKNTIRTCRYVST